MSGDQLTMTDIVSAGTGKYSTLTFSWELIDICQYKCSYCSAMNFNLSTFKKDSQERDAWRLVVKSLSSRQIKDQFVVEVLGGEPTLHPDLYEIIDNLHDITTCRRIELITNLAKPVKYFLGLDRDDNKLDIEASYHPEYCKQLWIDKIIQIHNDTNITIAPNINLFDDKKYWPDTKRVLEVFKQHDINVGLNFLQAVEDGVTGSWQPNYTEEFWSEFKDYLNTDIVYVDELKEDPGIVNSAQMKQIPYKLSDDRVVLLSESDINKYNLRQFKGWTCKPLMYHIAMDGVITNHCTHEHVPIYKMTSKELTCSRICNRDYCDCDTKFLYEKRRTGNG